MSWTFFRSSSALQRDPTRRKWKPLTSKINWKRRKVRSTSPSRTSPTASIFYLLGHRLLLTLSAKQRTEHLEASLDAFSRQARFLPLKCQTCQPRDSWACRHPRHLRLGRNSWCFSSGPLCCAPQGAAGWSSWSPALPPTERGFGPLTGQFLDAETKGLGFNLIPAATFGSKILQIF